MNRKRPALKQIWQSRPNVSSRITKKREHIYTHLGLGFDNQSALKRGKIYTVTSQASKCAAIARQGYILQIEDILHIFLYRSTAYCTRGVAA